MAILEAVHLCNVLADIPKVTQRNITKAFHGYYTQRASIAKNALSKSRQFGKVMGDRVKQPTYQLFVLYFFASQQPFLTVSFYTTTKGRYFTTHPQTLPGPYAGQAAKTSQHPAGTVPSSTALLATDSKSRLCQGPSTSAASHL